MHGSTVTSHRSPQDTWHALLAFSLAVAAFLGACTERRNAAQVQANEAMGQPPERVWLEKIGTGPRQTERVCVRGGQDSIARGLCQNPAPVIDGLSALYDAIGLGAGHERLVATTTHSLGLSARSVTAANPRTFVFVDNARHSPIPFDKIAAVAFSRGEQFVELAALDTKTYEYNFYLLAFEQACNTTRCTPEQLLTESVERDWTSWTLYSDADLVDTPLDCLSCHLPHGPGTHKLLLMRQLPDPWLHWGDFRGVYEGADCSHDGPPNGGRFVPGDGLDLLARLEGPEGRHAGIPVKDLVAAQSGRLFGDFIVDARLRINDSPYGSNYPQQELELDAARILCERLKGGTNSIWDQYRVDLTSRGLPVAYYDHEVMNAEARRELMADRSAVLRRHASEDPFEVASGFMDPAVASAVGLTPRESDGGRQLLRQMCVRCHSHTAPPDSKRARFNAESLDRIEPAVAQAILGRLRLPPDSPRLMPPRRSARLDSRAIERIADFLAARCTDPRAGACE